MNLCKFIFLYKNSHGKESENMSKINKHYLSNKLKSPYPEGKSKERLKSLKIDYSAVNNPFQRRSKHRLSVLTPKGEVKEQNNLIINEDTLQSVKGTFVYFMV